MIMDLSSQVKQIAERVKGLRQILDATPEEMAKVCDTTLDDYLAHENGECDFSFTFLYKCAKHFDVSITELITGDTPNLTFYTLVRNGEGLPIDRRKGFKYQHLASLLKDKIAEPFLVTAKYDANAENKPIELSVHEGHEFDFVLSGSLKIRLEDHIETLNEGDCVYYDSGHGHGMIATNGQDCKFLAVVFEKK